MRRKRFFVYIESPTYRKLVGSSKKYEMALLLKTDAELNIQEKNETVRICDHEQQVYISI